MAKLCFISLYDRNAYGLRVMSANLKKHGHRCSIIFLKRYDTNPTYRLEIEVDEFPWIGINKSGRAFKYAANSQISAHELDLLRDTVADINPDIIGMTVNTPLRAQATKVTRYLKQHVTVPILWGGYDATVNSSDCLALCDYTCVGEGDETVLDIAQRIDEGRPFDDVPNLAHLRDGKVVANAKYPVSKPLDSYPWRDDDPADKYFIEDNRVESHYGGINDRPKGVYQAVSARGCPYKCSYCCEATFKDLYSGQKFLRRRSPQDFVAELAHAKQQYGLTRMQFEDEIFAMDIKWLEEFVPLYKEKVDLPFTAYIYPMRGIERVLTLMKRAGLTYCCLALESGSERICKDVFDRVYNRDLFLKTSALLKELDIDFYTDVITWNPYEEEEDLRKTLDVLVDVRGGFDMCVNKLFVLPGTKMAEKMKQEGIVIAPSEKDRLFDYYCRLFWITSYTRHARGIVRAIEAAGIFRRYPRLLNPAALELIINPLSFARTTLQTRLPRPVFQALQSWKARIVARREAKAAQGSPDPVCR